MKKHCFNARLVKSSKKLHKCFTCLREIPVGSTYIVYPGNNSDGNFVSIPLCIECSYLVTQKTGPTATVMTEGELSEIRIPNCLRKKRNAYRENPQKVVEENVRNVKFESKHIVKKIVVKRSEFMRKIFHITETPSQSVDRFMEGQELIIQAGVNGECRVTTLKKAWSTKGDGFGCSRRQVALLTA